MQSRTGGRVCHEGELKDLRKNICCILFKLYPTPRISFSVRPQRFLPDLTHTIVLCAEVDKDADEKTDMEVDKVADVVADMVLDMEDDKVADELENMGVDIEVEKVSD